MSRDRDRILEQALKHELRAAGTQPAGVCLDAETLGAWTDGGLEPSAMASVEAHVSTCARCQALVGAMARGTPGTLGTPSTIGTRGTSSLWRWWLAPLAAATAAVTLWMVVPEQPELATAPPQPQAEKANEAPRAEPVPPATPADAAKEQPADKLARRDNKFATADREDRQQAKTGGERKEEEVAALQERARLADAAAPAAAATASAAPPTPAAAKAPAEFGALQKNVRAIVAPPGIEVTAQSAPSDSVCWFVGRAGLVLLTTDAGATFKRVDLSEPLDLSSVTATDARIAVVTAAGGRRFRTEDGGSSWRPF